MASLIRQGSIPNLAGKVVPAIVMQQSFRPTFLQNPLDSAEIKHFMHIGGHRGMGENLHAGVTNAQQLWAPIVPEFRENTLASFKAAADAGVSFVEFDVQVTRDGVPVIWHDDFIVLRDLSGIETEFQVKDLTVEEFQRIVPESTAAALMDWKATMPDVESSDLDGVSIDGDSIGGCSEDSVPPPSLTGESPPSSVVVGPPTPMRRLMRKFKDAVSLKNLDSHHPWTFSNDHSLPTLREMFTLLPKNLAFNVEVKMTNGEDEEFTPEEELERVVGSIMKDVDEFCPPGEVSEREMFFSSFDPDICALLGERLQGRFPVYFLSGCGIYNHVDRRRTSVETALEVASEEGLSGVVVPAEILLAHTSLVADARALGLGVMTYGHENSDPLVIELQHDLGVVATIVDSVAQLMPHVRVRDFTVSSNLVPASSAVPAMPASRSVPALSAI